MYRLPFFMLCIFLSVMTIDLDAQFGDRANPYPGASGQPDTSFNESDTLINKGGFFSIFKGKPGKAALYSLLIPGGGQAYNKKWWKVPLAVAIDAGTISWLVYTRSNFKTSQSSYQQALIDNAPNTSRLKQQRDYYRKQSEYAWIFLLIGHVVTVADAYVDRHMMTFDVSDDLTWQKNLKYPIENQSVIKMGFVYNLNKYSDSKTRSKLTFSIQ